MSRYTGLQKIDFMPQRYMSVAEYAHHISVSVPTLRRYIKSGTIPATKVGTRLTIEVAAANRAYDQFLSTYRQVNIFDAEEDEELRRVFDQLDD